MILTLSIVRNTCSLFSSSEADVHRVDVRISLTAFFFTDQAASTSLTNPRNRLARKRKYSSVALCGAGHTCVPTPPAPPKKPEKTSVYGPSQSSGNTKVAVHTARYLVQVFLTNVSSSLLFRCLQSEDTIGTGISAQKRTKIDDLWASMNAEDAPSGGAAAGRGLAAGQAIQKRGKKKAIKKANKVAA